MAKKKGSGKKQKLIINEKENTSDDQGKADHNENKKQCQHSHKAVRPQALKKALPHLKNGECKDCRGIPKLGPEIKGQDDKEVAQSVCICLKCGYQGCSRNCNQQHAHIHFQRQSSHTICVNTTTWMIWCYACDKELIAEEDNSDLQKAIKQIREKISKDSKAVNEESSPISGQVKGLRNLGNTCFFNSVMQNLSQTAVLIEKLDGIFDNAQVQTVQTTKSPKVEIVIKKTSPPGPLTSALKGFFDEFHSSSRGVVVPSKLFGEITKKSPQFRGYRQQDSQELLRYLLDGMRVEEQKRIESAMKEAVKNLETPPTKEELRDCFRNANTFVDDVFGGKLVSTIVCSECKTKSQVYDGFMDLSLPVNTYQNTVTKESAKSAATKYLNGAVKNEEKSLNESEEEKEKREEKLSKHQKKIMARKEKKAKRGKSKVAPLQRQTSQDGSKGNESKDDERQTTDDESLSSTGGSKDSLNKLYGQGPSAKDLNAELTKGNLDIIDTFTIKEENEFIVIDRKKKSEIQSEEAEKTSGQKPLKSSEDVSTYSGKNIAKDANQPILGGNASQMLNHSKSSSESLNLTGEDKYAAEGMVDVDVGDAQGKGEGVPADQGFGESVNCQSSSKESLSSNERAPCKEPLKCDEVIVAQTKIVPEDDTVISGSANGEPSESKQVTSNQKSHDESVISSNEESSSKESQDSRGTVASGKLSDTDQVISNQHSTDDSMIRLSETSTSKESLNSNGDKQADPIKEISNQQSLDESMTASSEVASSKESLESNGIGSSVESTETSSKESLSEASKDSLSEMDIASSKDSFDSDNAVSSKGSRDDVSPSLGSENAAEGDKNEEELSERMKEDMQIEEHIKMIAETGSRDDVSPSLGSENAAEGDKDKGELSKRMKEDMQIEEQIKMIAKTMSKKLEIKDSGTEKGEESLDESSDDVEVDEEGNENECDNEDVQTMSLEYECKTGECSIMSCLYQFSSKDVLQGNNKFRCDECTKRRKAVAEDGKDIKQIKPSFTVATKQMLLWEPPPVLTLHLKRFEQIGRGLRKVNKFIEFPLKLDMSPFCHANKSLQVEDLQYTLYGIVEHSGSLHGGHYVAYVKTRTVDNKCKWYHISDSRLSEIQEEAVLRKQAYIIFYHRNKR